jgi:hypothetical protein
MHSFFDGQKNEALECLKRAVELDPSNRELAKSNKEFKNLWEDRDFKDMVTIIQR